MISDQRRTWVCTSNSRKTYLSLRVSLFAGWHCGVCRGRPVYTGHTQNQSLWGSIISLHDFSQGWPRYNQQSHLIKLFNWIKNWGGGVLRFLWQQLYLPNYSNINVNLKKKKNILNWKKVNLSYLWHLSISRSYLYFICSITFSGVRDLKALATLWNHHQVYIQVHLELNWSEAKCKQSALSHYPLHIIIIALCSINKKWKIWQL